MGRHSAPGDDEDDEAAVQALMAELEARQSGRHSTAPDDGAEQAADSAAPASSAISSSGSSSAASAQLTLTPAPAARGANAESARGANADSARGVNADSARGANADLALLRSSPALRAQCIAAIIVPFGVFFAVLVALGNVGDFLLWVWIPTVVAGVLFGVFLDLAHRRSGTRGTEAAG